MVETLVRASQPPLSDSLMQTFPCAVHLALTSDDATVVQVSAVINQEPCQILAIERRMRNNMLGVSVSSDYEIVMHINIHLTIVNLYLRVVPNQT